MRLPKWYHLIRALLGLMMLVEKVYGLSPRDQQRLATIGLWGLVASLLVIAGGGILNALWRRRHSKYRTPSGPGKTKRKKRSKLPRLPYRKLHRRKRRKK